MEAARMILPASGNNGLDMRAVGANLEALCPRLPYIYTKLGVMRQAPTPKTMNDLMLAYGKLNDILVSGRKLTREDVLDLNLTCLFGKTMPGSRILNPYVNHFRDHFGPVWNEHNRFSFMPSWKRAALTYTRFVRCPQPLGDGNTRMGLLMVNYTLVRAGHKPFLPTPENAYDFLDISFQLMSWYRITSAVPESSIDEKIDPMQLQEYLAEMFRKHSISASRA